MGHREVAQLRSSCQRLRVMRASHYCHLMRASGAGPETRELRSQIMSVFKAKRLALAAVAALAFGGATQAADISGAGATFPYPIYSKWADAYKQQTGIGRNYQSIGSGGGIKQIKAKTVTFGASDMPLEEKDL